MSCMLAFEWSATIMLANSLPSSVSDLLRATLALSTSNMPPEEASLTNVWASSFSPARSGFFSGSAAPASGRSLGLMRGESPGRSRPRFLSLLFVLVCPLVGTGSLPSSLSQPMRRPAERRASVSVRVMVWLLCCEGRAGGGLNRRDRPEHQGRGWEDGQRRCREGAGGRLLLRGFGDLMD